MTEETVNQEQTSTEETTSQETETTEQSQAQPLTEERVQQLIAEATTKAVTQAKEAGRRELQGEQDRNRNAERRARLAESRVAGYETSFKGLDEETQKEIELARYREQDKYVQFTAQEEEQRQKEAAYFQQMNDSLLEEVRSWGVEPEDKRIDYASDAPDYFTGRKRFTDSLQKIVGENQKKAEEKQAEDFKNLESKLRKDLGLDSVDTTAGGGGGGDSDPEFKKQFGAGEIPMNKINLARAEKLGIPIPQGLRGSK